jgi:hypothetical protein
VAVAVAEGEVEVAATAVARRRWWRRWAATVVAAAMMPAMTGLVPAALNYPNRRLRHWN